MGRLSIKLFLQRMLATKVDMIIGVALGLFMSNSVIGFFFAGRAAVMLKIGSADTIWKGPIPMIMGVLGTFIYVLPLSTLLILSAEPLIGISLGKKILRLKIIPYNNLILSKKMLWCRSAIKTSIFLGLVISMLIGSWIVALCSLTLGFIVLCSMVLSLFLYIKPIHDALSQTCVIKIPKISRI